MVLPIGIAMISGTAYSITVTRRHHCGMVICGVSDLRHGAHRRHAIDLRHLSLLDALFLLHCYRITAAN
jgi:hypothetical protein